MAYYVLLFLEIFLLFFLSRKVSRELSKLLSINFLSFLFLPGVIIHELSHLLAAVILFVGVGDIEFAPKKNGDRLKLGSVEVAKTDPIRRSIIGASPVFVGLVVIIGIVYLFTSNIIFLQDKGSYVFIASIFITAYLLFAVSNTMFSSSRDMEGTIEILLTFFIIFAVGYFLGFRPQLSFVNQIFTYEVLEAVKRASLFLLAPIVIDIVLLGAINLIIQNSKGKSQKYK